MPSVIQKSIATAALRRIHFALVDATDGITPENITVTGVKAQLSLSGGTITPTTNDIVKVDGPLGEYYIELTTTEVGAVGPVEGWVKPTGCAKTPLSAAIVDYDPYAAPAAITDVWSNSVNPTRTLTAFAFTPTVALNLSQAVATGITLGDVLLGKVDFALDETAGTWTMKDKTGASTAVSGTFVRNETGALSSLLTT